MSRFRRIAVCAGIGAIIGGGIASLIVIAMMLPDPRFIADALKVLGTGGAIGGAICGAIIGLFANVKIAVTVGGIAGGIGGCALAMIGTLVYTVTPWPSPRLYPGAQPVVNTGGGSWGISRSQVYTITVSLDTVQYYYHEEMGRYCEEDWQFETPADCDEYLACRQAECEIRRFWMEQFFRVTLCSVSESETVVYHADMWQD